MVQRSGEQSVFYSPNKHFKFQPAFINLDSSEHLLMELMKLMKFVDYFRYSSS